MFVISLISATLLPLGSEPAVFGLVKLNPAMFWPAVLVATAGQHPGRRHQLVDGLRRRSPVRTRQTQALGDAHALQWLERFGPKACLLSWLPGVGDPLCAVAGFLKLPFWPCVLYMAIGKFAALCDHDRGAVVGVPGTASSHPRESAGWWPPRGTARSRPRGLPMSIATPAYDTLSRTWTRMHNLSHLQAIAGWDQAANMPPKGNEARAAAMTEMAALLHRMRTDPQLPEQLERAEQEPLSDLQRANLREMKRQWYASNALPESLVQRRQMASSRCEHAWRTQRPANDWAGFLGNFREVLAIAREEAALLSAQTGLRPYDALMDRFEPGMTCAQVDRVFGEVRQWLPGLIRRVTDKQAREQQANPVLEPEGPFPVAAQRALCERVMRLLGFDFEAGRLDVSTHPFCGGVPEDVRMTTRFREHDFLGSLMGTVHETGHGRYEQNLPRDWLGQPVAEARSMALHESQSLSFEMQLGSHPGFVKRLAPLVAQAFG